MEAFSAVDNLLTSRYGCALEDALCEGCLTGKLPGLLAEDTVIVRVCTYTQANEDGGQSFTFEGVFILLDVRYTFCCYIFVDGSGQRFVSDVASFVPVEWHTRVAM